MLATRKGAYAIYLFIAELNGYKEGTETDKAKFGVSCYRNNTLHPLDLQTEEDRKELHENIWLERLYDDLDKYYCIAPLDRVEANLFTGYTTPDYHWQVPLEADASASMLQWIGALLGDRRLLEMTNVLGDSLSDPWKFNGIPRTQFKHAATPLLYGSSRACHELWQDKGHKYTLEQVKLFNEELSSGALGLANRFKDFLIHYCKPEAVMDVVIDKEQFTIECNRFRQVGETTTFYPLWDTQEQSIRTIHHTNTKSIPDLDQFRRYFVTLLIF